MQVVMVFFHASQSSKIPLRYILHYLSSLLQYLGITEISKHPWEPFVMN